jgi:hypothetical protein
MGIGGAFMDLQKYKDFLEEEYQQAKTQLEKAKADVNACEGALNLLYMMEIDGEKKNKNQRKTIRRKSLWPFKKRS